MTMWDTFFFIGVKVKKFKLTTSKHKPTRLPVKPRSHKDVDGLPSYVIFTVRTDTSPNNDVNRQCKV